MATDQPILVIDQNGPSYPILLAKRLGIDAPVRLWAIGRLDLINTPKTAIFCSKRNPGFKLSYRATS
jgi:predicted Rossmann fold nucleotide-binding protein DprA/Smf involved in DNA uptake